MFTEEDDTTTINNEDRKEFQGKMGKFIRFCKF